MAPRAALLVALALLAGCWAPGEALSTYGTYTRPPASTTTCPSTCKVRNVVIYGVGTQTQVDTADQCIDRCRREKASHYSFSAEAKLCGCGSCGSGFVVLGTGSGVVSGKVSTCRRFPDCSRILTAKTKSQVCACPSGSSCKPSKSTSLNFQCCCKPTYPIVVGTTLVGCTATAS